MLRIGLNRLTNCQKVRGMSTSNSAVSKVNTGIEKVKEFLQSDGTKKAMKAALIELTPPTPAELPRAFRDGLRLFKGNWRELTVREAWLNTLVTTEVICWFFVGEVIGKGTLIGYQV